jgi:hypothetical protein
VHYLKMPVGFGRLKSKGRPLDEVAHLKSSIVKVKAEQNCLAHALVIAIARVTNDPNYKAFYRGRKIIPVVQHLLDTTGIDLSNGGGIPELMQFQAHFAEYRIVVYEVLRCDQIIFEGNNQSAKRLNLLFEPVTKHYLVINSLTGDMAKKYICKACNKSCNLDVRHTFEQTCSDCMANPLCVSVGVRILCNNCNRHFRSGVCFNNHKQRTGGAGKKSGCERMRCCGSCGSLITGQHIHECNKMFCRTCKKNMPIPQKNESPPDVKVQFVFYDFETTENIRFSDTATQHVPNVVCVKIFVQSGKRLRTWKKNIA